MENVNWSLLSLLPANRGLITCCAVGLPAPADDELVD
jgi:hypothetical protein